MNLDDLLNSCAEAFTAPDEPDQLGPSWEEFEARYQDVLRSPDRLAAFEHRWRALCDDEARYRRGEVLEQRGDLAAAADAFRAAAGHGFADASLRLAEVLLRLGDLENAEAWCMLAAAEGWAEAEGQAASIRAGRHAEPAVGPTPGDDVGAERSVLVRRARRLRAAETHLRAPAGHAASAHRDSAPGKEGGEHAERELRAAAREGRLAEYVARSPETANAILYRIVSELLYERLTQPAERARGHRRCAVSVELLEPDCRDRHQADVEAVRAVVLRHVDLKVENLPEWVVPRLKQVTAGAQRRWRGEEGAQQRPRPPLPAWLDTALGGDAWLSALAIEILIWVGMPISAQDRPWPLAHWAERRAQVTGDQGVTEAQVWVDIDRVLVAMRTNIGWYDKYVERPFRRKQPPLSPRPLSHKPSPLNPRRRADNSRESALLSLIQPEVDARLRGMVADAIKALDVRVAEGADLRSAIVEVLGAVFGRSLGAREVDLAPGDGSRADKRVNGLLADETTERVADAFLEFIKGR